MVIHDRACDPIQLVRKCNCSLYLHCKTLDICGIKFSRFDESDIFAHFNFGTYDITWLQIVKKTNLNFNHFFSSNFQLKHTPCHLLESPYGGDSDGMHQCTVSWDGREIIANTHQVTFLPVLSLC